MAAVIAGEMMRAFSQQAADPMTVKNSKDGKCKAEGGPAKCDDPDCPEGGGAEYTEENRKKIGSVGHWDDLGLPDTEDIKADAIIKLNDANEAKMRIIKGEKVKNPMGQELSIDSRSMRHIGKVGRKNAALEDKLTHLDAAIETVENPQEIWTDPSNGRRVYFRMMIENGKKRVVFAVAEDEDHVLSWHTNDRSFNHYRRGRIDYIRR